MTHHASFGRLVRAVGGVKVGDRSSRIRIDTIDRVGTISRRLHHVHISSVRSLVICARRQNV